MAIDHIPVDTNAAGATQAVELKQWVGLLRQVYEIGGRISGKMFHMFEGTDFTEVEKRYGLPVGEGQTVFDLVNGSVGSMEGRFQVDDVKTITEKVG